MQDEHPDEGSEADLDIDSLVDNVYSNIEMLNSDIKNILDLSHSRIII